MNKTNEIMELMDQIGLLQEKKREAAKNQNYEIAAKMRDEEKNLLSKIDEVSGVKDFYNKVYNSEKILQHLEILVNSTQELKKLRRNFREIFEDINFEKILINLYKQRDEAYSAVLQIKNNLK